MKINHFCESKKGEKNFARKVKNTYEIILKNLTLKARSGNKKAALELMEKITELDVVLYQLGFVISNHGRLKKI